MHSQITSEKQQNELFGKLKEKEEMCTTLQQKVLIKSGYYCCLLVATVVHRVLNSRHIPILFFIFQIAEESEHKLRLQQQSESEVAVQI